MAIRIDQAVVTRLVAVHLDEQLAGSMSVRNATEDEPHPRDWTSGILASLAHVDVSHQPRKSGSSEPDQAMLTIVVNVAVRPDQLKLSPLAIDSALNLVAAALDEARLVDETVADGGSGTDTAITMQRAGAKADVDERNRKIGTGVVTVIGWADSCVAADADAHP